MKRKWHFSSQFNCTNAFALEATTEYQYAAEVLCACFLFHQQNTEKMYTET